MNFVMDPVVRTLQEISHMLEICIKGTDIGLPVGYDKANLVMTGIGPGTHPIDVVIPLVVGIAIAGLWTIFLERLGYMLAAATKVGSGYLRKIAASKAKGGQDTSSLQRKYDVKHENFAQSFVETAFYSIDIFIAYRIFWGSSWCWPSHWHDIKNGLLSDGTVNLIPGVPAYHAPREMRAYYVIEFGFYFSQLLSLVSKKHKKDFWQMFVHHLLTSALIAFSYAIGFLRIGIIVMVCHSTFDPFLNAAKIFHYIFRKNSPWHILADISFALCAVTFFVCRFGFYPYAISATLNPDLPDSISIYNASWTENSLRLMLIALLPIHVFWFYLILKVLFKALGGGTVQGDARSDDEGTSEEASDSGTEGKKTQ
eukprot:m.102551 g.102551  ORF g.102551 m.102551 type:complete len:369 (+) comp10441_c1_seq1:102-1208(+)